MLVTEDWYLDADGTAPPAGVLALTDAQRTAAESIKAQDPPDAVPDHTHLDTHTHTCIHTHTRYTHTHIDTHTHT